MYTLAHATIAGHNVLPRVRGLVALVVPPGSRAAEVLTRILDALQQRFGGVIGDDADEWPEPISPPSAAVTSSLDYQRLLQYGITTTRLATLPPVYHAPLLSLLADDVTCCITLEPLVMPLFVKW